jgi:hypothetical protein
MANTFIIEFINIKNVTFLLFIIKMVLQNKRSRNIKKINNKVYSIILYEKELVINLLKRNNFSKFCIIFKIPSPSTLTFIKFNSHIWPKNKK